MRPTNRHLIYTASFTMDFICAFMVGAVAVFAVELGARPAHLGGLGAAGAGLYVVSSLIAGRLSDRFSRKWSMVAYAAITLAASLLFTGASRLWELYLYYAMFHVSIGLFWPTLQSLLGDGRQGSSLSATLGNFCIFWSLGFASGHYICGVLTEYDVTLPFTWCAIAAIGILLLCLRLKESEALEKSAGKDFLQRAGAGNPGLWKRFLACSWMGNFTLVFTLGAAKMLFPKLALEVDQLDRTVLGLMLALIHGGQFLVFWLVKYWHGWQYNRRTYLLVQLLALPGAGLLAFGSGVDAYAAGMLLVGITAGFTYSSSIYYSTSRPPDSATRTGFHEAFIGMGILLGPLAGGFVAELGDLHSPYALSLALVGVSLTMQTWTLLRPLETARQPERQAG